jgi:hypothetical protein
MICMHSLHTKWHIFHAEEIYEAIRIFGRKVSVTLTLYVFPLKVSRAKSISNVHCSAEYIFHTH